MSFDCDLALQFRHAVEINDAALAGQLISQFPDAPNSRDAPCPNDLYDLMNFTIAQGRVEILNNFVVAFKNRSSNGRCLARYALYTCFSTGNLECAEALQKFYPGEVIFCLPNAVENDQVHILEHFLPDMNADATDMTRLLIEAWRSNSARCFAYVLPQCPQLDGDVLVERFGYGNDGAEFSGYVAAQRQKMVLLNHVAEGRTQTRKM